jgi:arabinan endo-1,5-alpha-L-arabinosidase
MMRQLAILAILLQATPLLHAQTGNISRVHDPVIIREKSTWYVFSSGPGVPVRQSRDLLHWERAGRVFQENVPGWGKTEISGARDVWAPDISFYRGLFHLYYAISTGGSQRSCIGLATNPTLDPASPDFKWTDHGKVLETFPGKMDYNAIDPNLVLDEHGDPWLDFGSFWGGIKLVRLDADTGMRSKKDATVYALAARPVELAIEGAFLVHRNGWYYLFASFDHCCRGVASNYKVMVGRSREITGPYVDFAGRPMLDGGGTLVIAGHGHWRGPGHNGIFLGDDGDWFVNHMYDVDHNGAATMQIRPLLWSNGWPLVGEPIASPLPPAQTRPHTTDVLGIWSHSVDYGAEEYLELQSGGNISAAARPARWSLKDNLLTLQWPRPGHPEGWLDTCIVAPDGKSYIGRNQSGAVIRGVRP